MLMKKSKLSTVCRCAVVSLGVLLLSACAQHKHRQGDAHQHQRARFDDLPLPSDVPHGSTDWKAVHAALGATGKKAEQVGRKAGKVSKVAWEGTGGKVLDVAAGRIVREAGARTSYCGYTWPANGKISRGFRPASNHKGLDIAAPIGEPILAARAGRVIYSSNELSGFGNCIIIQHDSVWTSFYAHNDKNFVRAGDMVQKGQLIAEIGKTGRASGPHLHFEIRQNGVALDPHPMLP